MKRNPFANQQAGDARATAHTTAAITEKAHKNYNNKNKIEYNINSGCSN